MPLGDPTFGVRGTLDGYCEAKEVTTVADDWADDTRALARLPPVVAIRDLSKVYRVGNSRVVALNRVNLDFTPGSFTAIVGTSGSGKSTLLNMIAGLERPTAGQIVCAGLALHDMTEDQLVTYRRKHVGFIFQSFNLLPALTAVQNVALPLAFRGYPKRVRNAHARSILLQLGLEHHLHHTPAQLSGGQQQRVGIARALAVKPTLLFADEPTGNLDSTTAEYTLTLFRSIMERFGQTLIMVTHDHHLAGFADRIVAIGDGRIVGHEESHHPNTLREETT
ncbi:MAG: ABC transporter ATP-binding protein [Arachnia sp.]